jgi:pimeloyl-ACP methyl ester carboxylesterase
LLDATPPKTRYTKSGSVHLAYQVLGEGPPDLVFVSGWVSHIELYWEWPESAHFLRRLASFGRLILFDKRGTGLSDRVPSAELPTLEQRMDDVRAVMDAAGSERAALLGLSEGGPMQILFAATHPARTTALVLMSSFARVLQAPDYPEGVPLEAFEMILRRVEERWGEGALLRALAPGLADNSRMREYWARFQRSAASPAAAVDLLRMAADIDVRPILSAVAVPTLVLHRTGDGFVRVEQGRHLGRHITGARYIELDGEDHLPWLGDAEIVLGEIQEFLTGARDAPEPDRALATVLFVDLVGSTERAAALGDRRWREFLESFYARVRREIERFRGREIDTAGDGFLAAFDGPARGVRCACAINDALRPLGARIRAGLHTGECETIGEKLGGIAVHIGARVTALAAPDEVLVSSTVKDLVAGSGLRFQDRGVHALRGVPGEWRLFAVERLER